MAAEQRRRRKSDQPAPSPARERPADRGVGEGLPPGDHVGQLAAALELGAAEQRLHSLAAARRVGAEGGGQRWMRGAESPLLVEGPQEAGFRAAAIRRNPAALDRPVAEPREASTLAAPKAGIDTKSNVAPCATATRAQRKLTLAGRRSTTKRMRSSRGGSPIGNVAARWRRRRALGPSPSMSRASSASKSLAAKKASAAGLATTIRAGGLTIAKRALSLRQSCGACSGSKNAAASCGMRSARSAGGAEWVTVGARKTNGFSAVGGGLGRRLGL